MPTENKFAEPLKVERSAVTKLVITGAPRLDPINVFLEDFEPCKGKITVSCWDKSWNAYWGGMWDGHTIGQFFCRLDEAYIIGYFQQGLSSKRFCNEALLTLAKTSVIARRRMTKGYWEFGDSLDQEDARELYDQIDELQDVESIMSAHHRSELMTALFGPEWWYLVDEKAVEPNPDWHYLCSIIAAVQQALGQEQQKVAA